MNIPILYYHSIADHETKDPWSFLSVGLSVFRNQVSYLKKKGYYACDWQELADHLNGEEQLPEKTIMFHFDDGFLDNWSVVFPIMESAGFKYSILITPDFIQDGNAARPYIKKTESHNKANWWGYLNKFEIEQMAKSGLVDFQSHSYTHTWYPSCDEIIDIYTGENFYPHLHWNENSGQKAYWLGHLDQLTVPLGYPVFKYKKSLSLDQAFLPNPNFISEAIERFQSNDSKEIALEKIQNLKQAYKQKGILGSYETEEESKSRHRKELLLARQEIASITGKPCEYIVYPGGGNTSHTLDLSKKYGYKLVSKGSQLNSFGSKHYQVFRQSAIYPFKRFEIFLNNSFLKFQLSRGRGNKSFESVTRLLKR